MAQVGITQSASHGRARHAESAVLDVLNVLLGYRLPETRPAGAGFKLGIGTEKRVAAADAAVETFVMRVPVFAGKSHLCIFMARDVKGIGRELLFPFAVTLDDLGLVDHAFAFAGVGKLHNSYIFRWLLIWHMGFRRLCFTPAPKV